jgi:L-Ala-D/L-Glu epimerase
MNPSPSPRIRRIDAWPVTMRLTEPYAIAYETVGETTNVFLRVETDGGPAGCGCAAPDLAVCGETAESVLRALREVAEPMLRGAEATPARQPFEELSTALRGHPASLAAVDMALHDILAKVRGVPLHRLLGSCRDRIATSVTIGILPAGETVDAARRRVAQGFTCLKLKGGLDADEDAERVRRVRAAVGEGVELRFDANQGFTVEDTARFDEKTRGVRQELIEQPTPRDRLDQLAEAARRAETPVMADESLMSIEDARAIVSAKAADMLNIKLMKVGGIVQATRIDDMARAAGMPVMVGCMDEAALAIAAGLHFALARPNVRYADLDGHFDLEGDPSAGAVLLEGGRLRPTGRPGLGFELDGRAAR